MLHEDFLSLFSLQNCHFQNKPLEGTHIQKCIFAGKALRMPPKRAALLCGIQVGNLMSMEI